MRPPARGHADYRVFNVELGWWWLRGDTISRVNLNEIDLRTWRSLIDPDRDGVAVDVADRTGATVDLMLPGRVYFIHHGVRYAFVPASGEPTLGYDGARFRPSPDQMEAHSADMAALNTDNSIQDEAELYTAPLRPASVGPMLVAVTAVPVPERLATENSRLYSALVQWLGETGAALPTPDEWEYAHGVGAGTLWAWGIRPNRPRAGRATPSGWSTTRTPTPTN